MMNENVIVEDGLDWTADNYGDDDFAAIDTESIDIDALAAEADIVEMESADSEE